MITRSPGSKFPKAEAINFVLVGVSRFVVSLSKKVGGAFAVERASCCVSATVAGLLSWVGAEEEVVESEV